MNIALGILIVVIIVALAVGGYQIQKDLAGSHSGSPGGGLVTIPYNTTSTIGYTTSVTNVTVTVNNMGGANTTTAASTSSASTSVSTTASTTAPPTTVHTWG